MDRVLIVDDEPLVRIAMKTMVPWESLGFEIPWESQDGMEALNRLTEGGYSVLITDIRMPVMNGIDLIREAKKMDPNLICIALSAYDDFHFVKDAFVLGLHDYVLKMEMESDRLTTLFQGVRGLLDRSRNEIQGMMDDLQLVRDSKTLRKEERLKELLWKKNLGDGEWQDCIMEFGLRFRGERPAVLVATFDDSGRTAGRIGGNGLLSFSRAVVDTLNSVLEKSGEGEALLMGVNDIVVLLPYGNTRATAIQSLQTTCNRLSEVVDSYLGVEITFGICGLHLLGNISLHDRLVEARKAMSGSFLLGRGLPIFYDHINESSTNALTQEQADRQVEFMLKRLRNPGLDDGMRKERNPLLCPAAYRLQDIQNIKDLYAKYIHMMEESGQYIDEVRRRSLERFKCEYRSGAPLEALNRCLSDALEQISRPVGQEGPLVRQAKNIIHENYRNTTTLGEIARTLNVSTEHLCRIFHQQEGKTFTRYMMEYRIDAAKDLLRRNDLQIGAIAERVGYANVTHFNRAFRLLTGTTPKEFRQKGD